MSWLSITEKRDYYKNYLKEWRKKHPERWREIERKAKAKFRKSPKYQRYYKNYKKKWLAEKKEKDNKKWERFKIDWFREQKRRIKLLTSTPN